MQCCLLLLNILEKPHYSSKVIGIICSLALQPLIIIYSIKCICKSFICVSIFVYSHPTCVGIAFCVSNWTQYLYLSRWAMLLFILMYFGAVKFKGFSFIFAFQTLSNSTELGYNLNISDTFSFLLLIKTWAWHFMAILPPINWICFNLNLHIQGVHVKKGVNSSVTLY